MKITKIFLSILLIVIVAFSLFSCGEEPFDGTILREDGTLEVYMLPVENISEYTVIRARKGTEEATAQASSLRRAICDAIGSEIPIKTDEFSAKYEILIGNTDKKESKEASKGLRYDEYIIKKLDNKIIIAGGSDKALAEACEIYKENFIDMDKGIVKAPMSKYLCKGEYALDYIKTDGVDLSEFSVYFEGKLIPTEEGIIPEFITKIRERLGVEMKLVTQNMVNDYHYIVINNTGLIYDEYSIEAKDGNIYINGSYASIASALEYFVGDFLEGKDSIELESGKSFFKMSIGKKDIYSKDALMAVLTEAYNNINATIIGQQCEGGKAMIQETVADFEKSTGEKPGIIGLDLACYGVELPELSNEDRSKLICEIVEYASEGGLLTISSHWANPASPEELVRGKLGNFTTVDEFERAYREVYTPGTELNKIFVKELEINAIFLEALKNNGVPVIWRPLHEMNANWFWYCITDSSSGSHLTISAECFTDFWKYIYNYFDGEWKLDNLLWCFSPNTSSTPAGEPGSTVYCYPGDEYVDLVGCDWYTWGNLEVRLNDNYKNLVDKKMPGVIAEFGVDGPMRSEIFNDQPKVYNAAKGLETLKTLANEGISFAYLLTWTPGSQASIGVLGGDGTAEDFMEDDFTLGLNDVKAIFDKNK
ncbi:MAG: hypothetical protein IKJ91_04780 [Clostridia bacterium]|nr:hypothetical protein [Clostridia bacterium]